MAGDLTGVRSVAAVRTFGPRQRQVRRLALLASPDATKLVRVFNTTGFTVELLLQDSRRNKGLVISGGFALLVRPHGLAQAVDEFRR